LANDVIGRVVLRRLISAEQVIQRLATAEAKCQLQNLESHIPHPKLSHNEKWSFGDLGLAIAI
jgi:hypothetical protein